MKVGIVGYGSIGQRHAANAAALGHDVQFYDPGAGKMSSVRFERDIYDTCDAVVIATPTSVHIAGIRACAERGRHMLVEKPIATSMVTLREMLDFAESKKLVVMTGNNLRMHPCVQKAKEWLDSGMIGKSLWAHFVCAAQSVKPLYLSDGVILNTGAHEVDMVLHLFGPATVVYANATVGVDVIADFMLLHDNGCRSTFHLDFLTPMPLREFRITGDDGALYCDLIQRCLYRWQPDPKLPDLQHFTSYNDTGSYDADYLDEMRAFIDRIEGKDVPGATGEDGLATLQVLLDVRKKAGLE